MNAIDYMMQVEHDGLRLYETLLEEMSNGDRREIFTLLADAQKRHIQSLQTLKESVGPADAESEIVERAKVLTNGFRRLLESPHLHHQLRNDPDAFFHIVKAEEENIRLLNGMAAADPRPTVRILLQSFVEDEREHLDKIENIYDFLEAPRSYLEWGEFSNLRNL